MLMKWLERRREKDKNKPIEEEKLIKLRHAEKIGLIILRRKEMLKMPCAVNGMKECSSRCVHFSEGKIETYYSLEGPYETIKYPRCKLWGRK